MGRGLFAVAQDREAAGVFTRQRIGGDRTGRRGSNGCNLARMDDANGRAVFGVEQNNQTLMRLYPEREVLREDAD